MNKNQLENLQDGDIVIVPQVTDPKEGSVFVGDFVIMQDNGFMCAAGEVGRVLRTFSNSGTGDFHVEFSYGSDRRTSYIRGSQLAKIAHPEDAYRTLEHMLADQVLRERDVAGDVLASDVNTGDVLYTYDTAKRQIQEHHIQELGTSTWNAFVVVYDLEEDKENEDKLTLKFESATMRVEVRSQYESGLFSTIDKTLFAMEESLYQQAIPFLKRRMNLYRSRWNIIGEYKNRYENRNYTPVDPVTGKVVEFGLQRLLLFQCPCCKGYADYIIREAIANLPAYPDDEGKEPYVHGNTVHERLDDCAIEFDRCPHCMETLDPPMLKFNYIDTSKISEPFNVKLKSHHYDSHKD